MNSSNDQRNRRILVIDDNRGIHNSFREILRGAASDKSTLDEAEARLFGEAPSGRRTLGFTMESAYQGEEGIELVRAALDKGQPYAMAFVDMRMPPGMDGLETIVKLWELDSDLQVVICTAHSDYGWHDLQARLGSSDRLLILKKPFDIIEVRQMAEALCSKWELLRRSRHHLEELEARVTERTQNLSQANQELRDQIAERKQAEAALRESELRLRFFGSPHLLAKNCSMSVLPMSRFGDGPARVSTKIQNSGLTISWNRIGSLWPKLCRNCLKARSTTWNIASGITMVPSGGSATGVSRSAAKTSRSCGPVA